MTVAVLRSRQYVTNDTKELTGTVRPTWIDFSIFSPKAVAIFPNLVQAGVHILVSAAFLLSNIFCHVVTSQLKSIHPQQRRLSRVSCSAAIDTTFAKRSNRSVRIIRLYSGCVVT